MEGAHGVGDFVQGGLVHQLQLDIVATLHIKQDWLIPVSRAAQGFVEKLFRCLENIFLFIKTIKVYHVTPTKELPIAQT